MFRLAKRQHAVRQPVHRYRTQTHLLAIQVSLSSSIQRLRGEAHVPAHRGEAEKDRYVLEENNPASKMIYGKVNL
jgi:hypothetical protein